jgi:hypothetical protein
MVWMVFIAGQRRSDRMSTEEPTRGQLLDAVSSAVLAPSVHNTQPWLFRLTGGGIEVFADWRRRLPTADPTGRALRLSCGAAVLNLRIALARMGFAAGADVGPHADGPVATVLVSGRRPPTPVDTALYDAICRRHSNRFPFLDTRVEASERAALIRAAEHEGAWLVPITDPAALEFVAAMVDVTAR